MISCGPKYELADGSIQFDLYGLSSDTKPTGQFQGKDIGNAATFMEIDTRNVFFYDAEHDIWV